MLQIWLDARDHPISKFTMHGQTALEINNFRHRMVYSKLMCEVVTLPAHWTKSKTEGTVAKEKGRKKEEVRQKYRRKIAHTHHTFMPSLSYERERRPIKTSRFRGEEFLCECRLVAPGYTMFSRSMGSCIKLTLAVTCKKSASGGGDHGARRYRTQRRGEIKSTPARFEGRAIAAKLSVEKNREDIIWEGSQREKEINIYNRRRQRKVKRKTLAGEKWMIAVGWRRAQETNRVNERVTERDWSILIRTKRMEQSGEKQ